MPHHLARATALALLTSTCALAAPAQATDTAPAAETAPTITRITTKNDGGGLSGHLHLYTSVAITFTDTTPRPGSSYRLLVTGTGPRTFPVYDQDVPSKTFRASIGRSDLAMNRSYTYRVEELEEGAVVSTSAPRSFTLRHVQHPRRWSSSAKKVRGQWSHRAGSRARIRFVGKWERGAKVTTQVWVSRTKTFTDTDWSNNVYKKSALVRPTNKRVVSFKVPRKLAGKYVWVSVRGWKDGKAGWLLYSSPAKVIRR